MFRLDNKVVVLIGGNGYLGRNFTKVILEYGGIVYSCDKDNTEYEDVKKIKEKYPNKFYLYKVDCTKKENIL